MSLYKKLSTSGLVKTGFGRVKGLFCSSSSSGVVQLVDGITGNDDAADKASAVLTSSGAMVPAAHATSEIVSSGACVPAEYATSKLTSDGTNPAEDEVVVAGAVTYRFRNTLAQINDVKIGLTAEATLISLKKAMNGTGVDGTDYFAGTVANPDIFAGAITATTIVVWSRVIGTANNTKATTTTAAHLSWADTTLGGGTGDSNPGVATTAATITVGTTVYTATKQLAEVIGLPAVPYQVLWETSEAVFLDNFKVAVNAGTGEGTKYGTGTVAHADVVASTNTNTVQTLVARTVGATQNAIVTTTTLGNYAFADTTLGGGTGNSNPGVADTAAKLTVDGRTYTIVQELSETSGAAAVVDQILYGGSEAVMLDNVKVAFNAGATAGTNYSTGTVAHTTVEATDNTNTTQKFEARTAGAAGNSITVSETMANTTFGTGVTTLSGGLDANIEIIDEFTVVAGTQYPFSIDEGLDFNTGLYFRLISGTATVAIEYE